MRCNLGVIALNLEGNALNLEGNALLERKCGMILNVKRYDCL